MGGALTEAFGQVYGLTPIEIPIPEHARIEADLATLSGWDWLYGKPLPFSFSCEEKFDWGHIRLQLQVEAGKIIHAEVYSDAMDWALPEQVAKALTGCRFTLAELEQVLVGDPVYADILALLQKNI